MMNARILFPVILFMVITLTAAAQTDKKAAQLKNLEAGVTNAKARVAANEKKVADADSIINTGKKLIDEAKADAKSVDSDSRKLEKDYAAKYKSLNKITRSKDKAAANKAKADLRSLETEHRTGNRALETRFNNALKKQSAGIAAINKGRTAKKNAQDALKVSIGALKAAQKKYDQAAGQDGNESVKGKKKK